MPQIAENYANQFIVNRIQQNINYSDYYRSIAKQLFDVAENYNAKHTKDIYMGYVSVIRGLERLAVMYENKSTKIGEFSIAKHVIFQEYSYLINDLENHFESYPDEIIKRDIANGKMLASGFNMQM